MTPVLQKSVRGLLASGVYINGMTSVRLSAIDPGRHPTCPETRHV